MKLTLEQAAKELKLIEEYEIKNNSEAINRRYGNKKVARKVKFKLRDFIRENDYCTSCYNKKTTAADFNENNCGLCDSCYRDWEDAYLSDGR